MSGYIFGQAFVVVWRESMEAILVISILYAYLARSEPRALKPMWLGVGMGLLFSLLLAYFMLSAQSVFSGRNETFFEVAVLGLSCGLMTQMVFWMQKHARTMRQEIESSLRLAVADSRHWAVTAIAALAVAREGSEAVIYVYSLALESHAGRAALAGEVLCGVAAALGSAWLIARGIRFLKNGWFFNFTSLVLLLSAASLGASAVGKLVEEGLIPGLIDPLWDWSRYIPSENGVVTAFKMVVGYNPRPSLSEVLAYALYWLVVGIVATWPRMMHTRRAGFKMVTVHGK